MASHGSRVNTINYDPDELVLVVDPSHPLYDERVHLEPDEAMIKSVMDIGITQNITTVTDGDRILVATGRRRVKAAREANKLFKQNGSSKRVFVPSRPARGSNVRLLQLIITENEARVNDTPYIKALKAQRMLDFGASEEEILKAFCVTSWQTIVGYLKILELDEVLQKAVQAGDLSANQANQFHGLQRKEQVVQYEAWKARQEMSPEEKKSERKARKAQRAASGPRAPQKKKVRKVIESLGTSEGTVQKAVRAALQWVVGDLSIEEAVAQIEDFPSL